MYSETLLLGALILKLLCMNELVPFIIIKYFSLFFDNICCFEITIFCYCSHHNFNSDYSSHHSVV